MQDNTINKKLLEDLDNYNFKVKIPDYFFKKINFNDPNCPLLLQVLPSIKESITSPEYKLDPLKESSNFNKIPGLLHKYKTRVLIMLATSCEINCRYCFRRHFNYKENNISLKNYYKIIDYIKNNKDINEVIFSGGDPLVAPDKYIANITNQIAEISHIKYIRLHTRIPIVNPDRINQNFCDIFNKLENIKTVLVTHCNHPKELDDYIKSKMLLLKNNNFTVLNQSVLLKNINDNADILANLSYKLFDCNVMPYYIHLLDPVQNAKHFEVTKNTAINIFQELKNKLPGYLLPKLMQEVPGEFSKTQIFY